MIKYKTSSNKEEIIAMCKAALIFKLHFTNNTIHGDSALKEVYENPSYVYALSLAHFAGTPIGCCAFYSDEYTNLSVFVKKNYRRRGIGTYLVSSCVEAARKAGIFEEVRPYDVGRDRVRFYETCLVEKL